jgi:hypothetical protein
MADWMEEYRGADTPHERYEILCREMTRLRETHSVFEREAVAETVSSLNEQQEGELIVFAANDFGLPMAYRPEETGIEIQAAVRRAILENKYDDSHEELNVARQKLLEKHPRIHKAILAECNNGSIRYHLPEGSNMTTNFITVREMVGLVDYTTNSFQREGLSMTY